MNYKFIDIGTGHHSVSSDIFGTEVRGMYVEPIQQYLDVLPNGTNIIKENCVISNINGIVEFNAILVDNPKYFSNNEMINIVENKNKLTEYLKKYDRSGQSSLNVFLKNSKKIKVVSLTLKNLFEKHNVTSIDYLKIDAEGHEEVILKQLITLLHNKKISINNEIKFEYNNLSDKKKLDNIANIFCDKFNFNKIYSQSLPWNEDIILVKK